MRAGPCALLLFVALAAPARAQVSSLHVRINGLPVELTHARGAAAGQLAERETARLLALASRAAGRARWQQSGGWRVLSAAEQGRSYALQLRGSGAQAEALFSSADLARGLREPAPPPLGLPPGATLVRAVEGLDDTGFAQWSARSRWSARSTLGWLALVASARGWRVEASDRAQLALARDRRRLQLVVLPEASRGGSAILMTHWRAR